jgi:hypothetical protein
MRVVRLLIAPAVLAAAYGAMDGLRGMPGPVLPLALALREAGHSDGLGVPAFVVVWVCAGALVALWQNVPRRMLAVAAGLGFAALAASLIVQAVSLRVVRQARFGFDWAAALASPSPWVTGSCVTLGAYAVWTLRVRARQAS